METRPETFRSSEMRAGNTDREDCASYLVEHHLEGRLSTEELERRQRAAHAAVTISELRALFADLPGNAAQRLGRPSPEPARRPIALSRPGWLERIPRRRILSVATAVVPPAALITGSALFSQSLWQYNSEAALSGAFFTGTLAYGAGVVTTRLRHRRATRARVRRPRA